MLTYYDDFLDSHDKKLWLSLTPGLFSSGGGGYLKFFW